MSILSNVIDTVKEILAVAQSTATGMSVTLSHIPTRKATVSYPDEPVTIFRRFRGEHFLDVNEDGKEKCVSCFLCAAACPADAIYIEGAEDPRPYEERISMDHRYAKVYQIDYGRCILCGFCVDACPTDAIIHGHNFEWAVYTPGEMVKDKEFLLANKWREPDVKPNEKQKHLAAKQKLPPLNIILK
ncbi:MAG: NADH-quinone oxidoreductase subunit I [Blastocatellales bacterium]|nr:NADH-quinone oxidoreductase subunit I [Blastocatellales bacterium]